LNEIVNYRSFQKEDIHPLALIINNSWNYEEMFQKNIAKDFSYLFLYYELFRRSFAYVAEKDDEPLGVIMGEIKDQKKSFKNFKYIPQLIFYASKLLLSKEGRAVLYNYVQEVGAVNQKMLDGLNKHFKVELSLFAVSPDAQGLGVGTTLFQHFLDTLKQKNIHQYFLYTDDTSNYVFYDHKGLNRTAETNTHISEPINEEKEFYIYQGGDFNENS